MTLAAIALMLLALDGLEHAREEIRICNDAVAPCGFCMRIGCRLWVYY